MTACVNETKKTVGGGVLQSKVLRAVMALVLAIGLMPVASGTALAAQFNSTITGFPGSYDGIEHDVTVTLSYSSAPTIERTVELKGGNDYSATATVKSGDWKEVKGEEGTASTYEASVTFKGVIDPGEYTVTSTYVYNETPAEDALTAKSFEIAEANVENDVTVEQTGETVGWNEDGDLTDVANATVSAKLGEHKLVQGTKEAVEKGDADYWIEWTAKDAPADSAADQSPNKVIGSNDQDVVYEGTLHFGANFTDTTKTVSLTVSAADATTAKEDFERGALTGAVDNNGAAVSSPFEFTYDRGAHYIVPTQLTTVSGQTVDLTAVDADGKPIYSVAIYKAKLGADGEIALDASGNYYEYKSLSKLNGADVKDAGTYFVNVYANSGDYQGSLFQQAFTIEKATLTAANVTAEDDFAPAFTWNGENRIADDVDAIDFVWDGADLVVNEEYTVKYYKLNDSVDGNDPVDDITAAGSYVARVAGEGNFTGTAEVRITIAKLDLSQANLAVSDMQQDALVKVEEIPVLYTYTKDGAAKQIDLRDKGVNLDIEITSDQALIDGLGEYAVKVTPAQGEGNVTGEGTASFAVVKELVTKFQYKGVDFSAVSGVVFNVDRGQALDPADIAVYDKNNNALKKDADWTLKVTDLEGNEVPNYATTAGDYIATVSVNHGDDFARGGEASFAFQVRAGSLAETDVFVTFDGKVCGDKKFQFGTLYWNGQDQSDRFAVAVVKDGKRLAEGTDYEWYFTQEVNGRDVRVDELTMPGTYALHVDGIAWAGSFEMVNNIVVEELPITVAATGMKSFDVRDNTVTAGTWKVETEKGYPYTGSQVTPTFGWTENVADPYYEDLSGDLEAADYTAQYFKATAYDKETGKVTKWTAIDADEIVEAGDYKAQITLTASGKAKFELADKTEVEFKVIDRLHFEDVLAADWYSERVYEAWAEGYVNGIANTKLFRPDSAIMRGDVACIMFNVAVAGGWTDLNWWTNAGATSSAFPDVAVGAYWTPAINWASSSDVVNGYADTGLYEPEKNITREEFASILANYAKATRVYAAPTTDLSDYSDASGVSDWAVENVEWAVENGVMGRGGFLNAQETITRAEVAAMVMNYMEQF